MDCKKLSFITLLVLLWVVLVYSNPNLQHDSMFRAGNSNPIPKQPHDSPQNPKITPIFSGLQNSIAKLTKDGLYHDSPLQVNESHSQQIDDGELMVTMFSISPQEISTKTKFTYSSTFLSQNLLSDPSNPVRFNISYQVPNPAGGNNVPELPQVEKVVITAWNLDDASQVFFSNELTVSTVSSDNLWVNWSTLDSLIVGGVKSEGNPIIYRIHIDIYFQTPKSVDYKYPHRENSSQLSTRLVFTQIDELGDEVIDGIQRYKIGQFPAWLNHFSSSRSGLPHQQLTIRPFYPQPVQNILINSNWAYGKTGGWGLDKYKAARFHLTFTIPLNLVPQSDQISGNGLQFYVTGPGHLGFYPDSQSVCEINGAQVDFYQISNSQIFGIKFPIQLEEYWVEKRIEFVSVDCQQIVVMIPSGLQPGNPLQSIPIEFTVVSTTFEPTTGIITQNWDQGILQIQIPLEEIIGTKSGVLNGPIFSHLNETAKSSSLRRNIIKSSAHFTGETNTYGNLATIVTVMNIEYYRGWGVEIGGDNFDTLIAFNPLFNQNDPSTSTHVILQTAIPTKPSFVSTIQAQNLDSSIWQRLYYSPETLIDLQTVSSPVTLTLISQGSVNQTAVQENLAPHIVSHIHGSSSYNTSPEYGFGSLYESSFNLVEDVKSEWELQIKNTTYFHAVLHHPIGQYDQNVPRSITFTFPGRKLITVPVFTVKCWSRNGNSNDEYCKIDNIIIKNVNQVEIRFVNQGLTENDISFYEIIETVPLFYNSLTLQESNFQTENQHEVLSDNDVQSQPFTPFISSLEQRQEVVSYSQISHKTHPLGSISTPLSSSFSTLQTTKTSVPIYIYAQVYGFEEKGTPGVAFVANGPNPYPSTGINKDLNPPKKSNTTKIALIAVFCTLGGLAILAFFVSCCIWGDKMIPKKSTPNTTKKTPSSSPHNLKNRRTRTNTIDSNSKPSHEMNESGIRIETNSPSAFEPTQSNLASKIDEEPPDYEP